MSTGVEWLIGVSAAFGRRRWQGTGAALFHLSDADDLEDDDYLDDEEDDDEEFEDEFEDDGLFDDEEDDDFLDDDDDDDDFFDDGDDESRPG